MTTMYNPAVRRRIRAMVVTLVTLCTLCASVAVGLIAAPAAGAAGQIVTYSATTTQPGPLTSNYVGGAAGDGWAVALSSTQVFNVSHHLPQLDVTCHNQSDGSACWGADVTKVVTNGNHNYATSMTPGLYLDQATGYLYVYAVQTTSTGSANQAGVVCIDTTQPASATGAALFCGFTPLTKAGDSPIPTGQFAGITSPVQIGSNWYAYNEVSDDIGGGGSGTANTLMCFSLTTLSACPTSNYTLDTIGPVQIPNGVAPPMGAVGNDVMLPIEIGAEGTSALEMLCFDTTTAAACAGSWPVTIPALAGSPYPMLNSSGTPIGVCVPVAGAPCFDFTGAPLVPPAALDGTIGTTAVPNGPAVTIGASVYVANYNTDIVECFDFATDASCVNYPKAPANLYELYTVNRDPYRPDCLWVNSDHGSGQIQSFDAPSGGACSSGPVRLQASSVVHPSANCEPTSTQGPTYLSLQVTSPQRSTYASASVAFANDQGVIDQSIPAQQINAFGGVDLSGLDFSSDLMPQFVITLNGQTTTPATVTLRLTWNAPYAPVCVSGGQSASSRPAYWTVASDGGIFNYGNSNFYGSTGNLTLNKPIVGMALMPDRSGYWLVASDGGVFAYGDAGFYGSTGNIHLNKPIVGLVSTPDGGGYWMVASDGGIFAYGDAGFFGSAGNLTLNQPIVGMASTPDGGGYWMVASDGGIFAYGDAQFYGSTGNIHLNKPIVGMAANPSGGGYWMVASDGGIFNYGTARFLGSAGGTPLNKPIVGMAPTFDGTGYWLVASDGGIFSYGSATFAGSAGNLHLNKPMVGMAA